MNLVSRFFNWLWLDRRDNLEGKWTIEYGETEHARVEFVRGCIEVLNKKDKKLFRLVPAVCQHGIFIEELEWIDGSDSGYLFHRWEVKARVHFSMDNIEEWLASLGETLRKTDRDDKRSLDSIQKSLKGQLAAAERDVRGLERARDKLCEELKQEKHKVKSLRDIIRGRFPVSAFKKVAELAESVGEDSAPLYAILAAERGEITEEDEKWAREVLERLKVQGGI